MSEIRKPAVASMFYPDEKINLKKMINTFLSNVPDDVTEYFIKKRIDNLFGIISPHAGYVYSGSVAAHAYALLKQKAVDTIILIGPSHYNQFSGYALTHFSAFETPLGEIPVDEKLTAIINERGRNVFEYVDTAHIREHSIEVQLPFLQTTLINNFKIVPILMGEQTISNVTLGADILKDVLSTYDKSYLIVISSDLSHYYSDEAAHKLDDRFLEIVEGMDAQKLMQALSVGETEACGGGPVAVLLELAKKMSRGSIRNLVYNNSGDTSGDYSRVVGYLASAVW
ncbi:MAG: AmmeMemoRadiSam system protein B [Spirochaetes bacterium GWF1_51_8]|nr:MAG: AmmeMemoRadiSam system protein B [Spirochaetes bacterium GWF1_51_8]